MRAYVCAALASLSLLTAACGAIDDRVRYPGTESALALDRVILYRNGVGYFERRGEVEGNILRIKVRKDQINDLLKSLTIVDRKTGHAVSVSMPLDPDTWANAALATLAPNNGSLAQVLDLLRGAEVALDTTNGTVEGRIVMVESISEEPDPELAPRHGEGGAGTNGQDHKVTLMEDTEMRVVRLSKVKGITLKDGDLAMQFHRRLDATAGEGMFQQVEVAIRLDGTEGHDLVVSYVVEAPMWKPTYRVVLDKDNKNKALLQAWAVVDNTSGEDWRDVKLALTAGAPIAFQYDMHTPRRVARMDITGRGEERHARVAMGETSYDEPAAETEDEGDGDDNAELAKGAPEATEPTPGYGGAAPPASRPYDKSVSAQSGSARYAMKEKKKSGERRAYRSDEEYLPEEPPAFSPEALRRSTLAKTKASHASGLTRYDVGSPVTVPDGSSTMVALVNVPVVGEEVFLFDPRGGGGEGYENNPFRVVRFKNSTPFVLEPGPISIYSGGSFVGEGISEAVGANTSATIPFAVEPSILVTSENPAIPQQLRLLKIADGVVYAERFYRYKTVWNVKAQSMNDGFKVLIRHPKQGGGYKLQDKITGMEELADAYMIPIAVAKGKRTGSIELVEQTPSEVQVGIFEADFLGMLERAVVAENFTAEERAKLKPIIELRREIAKLETQIATNEAEEAKLNSRMEQHRQNIDRLKNMKSAEALKMIAERTQQLEEFTKQGDKLALETIKLTEAKEQKVIQLGDKIATLTIGK